MQKKLIAMIPAPADLSGGDAAEAAGRTGKISAMGMDEVKATQLPSNRMELFVCGLTRLGRQRLTGP